MLIDFRNFFTVGLSSKFAMSYFPPQLQCVATLTSEKNIKKIAKVWLSNTISPFCLIVDKSNQINLFVCVLLIPIKCQNILFWYECIHGNIWDTHKVHDVDEQKQRLMTVWRGLGQSVIDDAMDEWHKRLWACVHVKGGHFEHLI